MANWHWLRAMKKEVYMDDREKLLLGVMGYAVSSHLPSHADWQLTAIQEGPVLEYIMGILKLWDLTY